MKRKYYLSFIILLISIALYGSFNIYYSFEEIKENELISRYLESNETTKVEKIVNEENEEYYGIIEIPSIKLKEGFYRKNSINNNINKSVTILKESVMPDKDNSIVYLAAHSGNGHLAYFKDLYKLKIEDMIYLNYNKKNYTYTIVDIYELDKVGNISINRNIHDNYLILTTCSNNKNKQLVVVSKLFNKI